MSVAQAAKRYVRGPQQMFDCCGHSGPRSHRTPDRLFRNVIRSFVARSWAIHHQSVVCCPVQKRNDCDGLIGLWPQIRSVA